eukprot:12619747-Ditylum_brightwellii.AAC.1
MKVMSKDEMILSGYMQSNHYCSYLRKHGRNSVGFWGQANQMTMNFMYLLVLIEMVKGNMLCSNTRSFMNKGKGVYEGVCQTCSGYWTEQVQPQHVTDT